jgi:hypothetical protein
MVAILPSRAEVAMSNVALTHHAARRLQQRGIPEDVLPLLMRFGAYEYDKNGARLIYMTQKSRRRLRKTLGDETYGRLEPTLDVYAVAGTGGTVLTVGHRTQRINRN